MTERMSIGEYRASQKRNKYHAQPVEIDGHRFPSKREAKCYQDLRLLERNGEISDLRLQVRYPLIINGHTVSYYVADFVFLRDGKTVVADAKGMLTPVYRMKKKMMFAQYGVDIEEL